MTSIRLNSTIQFDENAEKDIIELISNLNSCHKTGQFVGTLIRLAVDNPEVLKKADNTGRYNIGELYSYLNTSTLSRNRAEFFSTLYKDVLELKEKVDSIYKMSLELRTLAQFGKQIGIEERSKNTMRAGFLLEKQVSEIQNKLGTQFGGEDSIFMSNKLNTSDKVVNDIMEFIINTYSGIVEEIKDSISIPVVQAIPIQQAQQAQQAQQVAQPEQTTQAEQPVEEKTSTKEKQTQSTSNKNTNSISVFDEDEIIDFGSDDIADEDLDALASFFGSGG